MASVAFVGVTGCDARLATVLESDVPATTLSSDADAPDSSTSPTPGAPDGAAPSLDASAPASCTSVGGVCLPPGSSAPPAYRSAGPGEVTCGGPDVCWLPILDENDVTCRDDSECNTAPTISSQHGKCFHGICVCLPGWHVQPSGKCDLPPPAAECSARGGTCHQLPAACPTGKIQGTPENHMSCGDFVEAVCCYAASSCKNPIRKLPSGVATPVAFYCCNPGVSLTDPICINGHKTCLPGELAVESPTECK